jgi:hypothetical protein
MTGFTTRAEQFMIQSARAAREVAATLDAARAAGFQVIGDEIDTTVARREIDIAEEGESND